MLSDLPLQSQLEHELSPRDMACLLEIKQVLMQYGSTKRFGITLLHRHFDLDQSEIPLEESDISARTSSIQIRQIADIEDCSVATAWRLDGDIPEAIARCSALCRPVEANADSLCNHYSKYRNIVLD